MMIFVSVPLLIALPFLILYWGVKQLKVAKPHWFRQDCGGTAGPMSAKEIKEMWVANFVFFVLCPAIVAIMAWGYGLWD